MVVPSPPEITEGIASLAPRGSVCFERDDPGDAAVQQNRGLVFTPSSAEER
jgi:hypothetical protein